MTQTARQLDSTLIECDDNNVKEKGLTRLDRRLVHRGRAHPGTARLS